MIKMVRIDERLIHGQVALIWTRELAVDRIVCVNDKAASDSVMTATLKMAAPESIKTIVVSREDAKRLFADPRFDSFKVLVVVNSPQDALFVAENAQNIVKVNIGNYGKADKTSTTRERLNDNVFLDADDAAALKHIIDLGIQTEYQLVPGQPVVDLKGVL